MTEAVQPPSTSDTAQDLAQSGTFKEEDVAVLAACLARRVQQPVDEFEVAVHLETMGINRDLASRKYNSADVFSLARDVLCSMHSQHLTMCVPQSAPAPAASTAVADFLRGPLSVSVVVLLFATLNFYRHFGAWNEGRMLAMSIGITSSVLIANTFVQGAARRCAIFISRGRPRAALRYLAQVMLPATCCVVGVAGAVWSISLKLGLLSHGELLIFFCTFVTLAGMWFLSALLSMFQKPIWFALGLGTGLAVAATVDLIAVNHTSLHLGLASVCGIFAALLVMGRALARAVRESSSPEREGKDLHMPSIAYLVQEAAPYTANGALYMMFIFLPHVIGWLGILNEGESRRQSILVLEIGLTFSLLPVLLAEGIIEHAVKGFWTHARSAQFSTTGLHPADFVRGLELYWSRWARAYVAVLAILCVVTEIAYLLLRGSVIRQLQVQDPQLLDTFFMTGIMSYFLLGCGLLSCVFAITLAQPSVAIRAALLGIAVSVAISPLSFIVHYSYTSFGFLIGTIAFAWASISGTLRILKSADYYYVASF